MPVPSRLRRVNKANLNQSISRSVRFAPRLLRLRWTDFNGNCAYLFTCCGSSEFKLSLRLQLDLVALSVSASPHLNAFTEFVGLMPTVLGLAGVDVSVLAQVKSLRLSFSMKRLSGKIPLCFSGSCLRTERDDDEAD